VKRKACTTRFLVPPLSVPPPTSTPSAASDTIATFARGALCGTPSSSFKTSSKYFFVASSLRNPEIKACHRQCGLKDKEFHVALQPIADDEGILQGDLPRAGYQSTHVSPGVEATFDRINRPYFRLGALLLLCDRRRIF